MSDIDAYAKLRRDILREDGCCINGRNHPRPVAYQKCDWCRAVHRHGVELATKRAALDPKAPQPPRRSR